MSLFQIGDGAAAVSSIDFTSYITALTGSITPAQVLTVLAAVVGVGMVFFLMWLGVRKATKGFTTAVSNCFRSTSKRASAS